MSELVFRTGRCKALKKMDNLYWISSCQSLSWADQVISFQFPLRGGLNPGPVCDVLGGGGHCWTAHDTVALTIHRNYLQHSPRITDLGRHRPWLSRVQNRPTLIPLWDSLWLVDKLDKYDSYLTRARLWKQGAAGWVRISMATRWRQG